MVKLVALYRTPKNEQEFDSYYATVHTPLVKKIPGLRRLEVARITGAPIGEPQHYLIAEMFFDDQDVMQKSLSSPEGKATARDLVTFAGNIVTMFYAEVKEA